MPSTESSRDRCSFCGEVHPPGPAGEKGSAFAGIEFKTCPKIPEDHLYVDEPARKGKPRGALFTLRHARPMCRGGT